MPIPARLAGGLAVALCLAPTAARSVDDPSSTPSRSLSTAPSHLPHPTGEVRAAPDSAAATDVDRLVESLPNAELRRILGQVLDRDPSLQSARAESRARGSRVTTVRGLPDPRIDLEWFARSPETRVGPQSWRVGLRQEVPWPSVLARREQLARREAEVATTRLETLRLARVTEARILLYEISFLTAQEEIVRSERQVLERYERAAQARYAAGTGTQQEIVRIQAEITRTDTRLLSVRENRTRIRSELNRLRDLPCETPLEGELRPPIEEIALLDDLPRRISSTHPEHLTHEAMTRIGELGVELAALERRPALAVGLSYTAVDRRDDPAGRLAPPLGDGDDILSLTGSISIPWHRERLAAREVEADHRLAGIRAHHRGVMGILEARTGDLATRIPLLTERLQLQRDVLLKQAGEALRSAETAYSTGRISAVDLLDAEVVLYEVRLSIERIHTDLATAIAELEHLLGRPLGESR